MDDHGAFFDRDTLDVLFVEWLSWVFHGMAGAGLGALAVDGLTDLTDAEIITRWIAPTMAVVAVAGAVATVHRSLRRRGTATHEAD